jgi:UDP-N-acetylglucosamine--N-acetylmuramyl-(pentapeptide) pyrophosphoryl-undecaprenol N-acetylglucosamine transferase
VDQIEAATPFVKNPALAAGNTVKLAKGFAAAGRIVAGFKPDLVAGFGGYPAFPALAHAQLKRIPFVIHEQNAVLGRVNRVFAARAFAVASGFERLDRLPRKARHVVTEASKLRGAAFTASGRGKHASAREYRYRASQLEARLVDALWREKAAELLQMPLAA